MGERYRGRWDNQRFGIRANKLVFKFTFTHRKEQSVTKFARGLAVLFFLLSTGGGG